MRKKVSSITLLAVIVLILLHVDATGEFSGAGSGTQQDPYIITNVAQLQEMNDELSAWYELGNDIDASVTSGWHGGAGFIPIGDYHNRFTGHFDGGGYRIVKLYVNRPFTQYVGLFGETAAGSEIKKVGLVEVSMTGRLSVGGLAGTNCGTISNSYSTGTIESSRYHAGGLVGLNNYGKITNCYSSANARCGEGIPGGSSAGGLVAVNGGSVSKCYSNGIPSGKGYNGGLIGYAYANAECLSSFWDVETSGKDTSAGGLGKTTTEMKRQATFFGWDFDTVWDIVEGQSYPFLIGVDGGGPEKPLESQLAIDVIGADYLWGAKGWEGGRFLDANEIDSLDCSGLSYWSYNKAGGATAYSPWHEDSYVVSGGMVEFLNPIAFEGACLQHDLNVDRISRDELLAGDLLFFDAEIKRGNEHVADGQDGRIDHVAMYVGDWEYGGVNCNVVEATLSGEGKVIATTVDAVIERIRRTSGPKAFDDATGFGKVRPVPPLSTAYVEDGLKIPLKCPASLVVCAPDGSTVADDIREASYMVYLKLDTDEDGELDDVVFVFRREVGDYSISVVPDPGASPSDTYSLEVTTDSGTFTFAEDVPMSDIPDQPYGVRVTETSVIPIIPATADFDPDTINLKGEGKWITVYIELPTGHGYDVSDINLARTFLEGLLEVQHSDVQDGVLMVKFDRQDIIIFLKSVVGVIPPDDIPLTVTGELKDGRRFEGSDTVRVIDKGSKK